MEELAEEAEGVKICKVDVDQQPELARQYKVMSHSPPSWFSGTEKVVKRDMGYKPKDELLEFVKIIL